MKNISELFAFKVEKCRFSQKLTNNFDNCLRLNFLMAISGCVVFLYVKI